MKFRRALRTSSVVAAFSCASPAFAREASPAAPSEDPIRADDPYPWSAAARAWLSPTLGVAGTGVGIDLAYSLHPNLAAGAAYTLFTVDQGGDPHYCRSCIREGWATFAFAEGRYWPEGWVTPYARLGAGLTHLRGQPAEPWDGREYTENDLAVHTEAGLDVHYRWVSLRLFVFDHLIVGSALDEDPFLAVGAQLGARF